MATKKTYKAKVAGYVPQAIDGDGDGLVQDGTEFERPECTEIDVLMEEVTEEIVEKVLAPGVKTNLANTHTLKDGENIQTVARLYCPNGMNRNTYAQKLYALNKSWATGVVIRLG